jgi:hypothetical protein
VVAVTVRGSDRLTLESSTEGVFAMPTTVHDVAILCDFRFAGAGVAAEVRAQAEAALSTVLVHVPADDRPLPFTRQIRDCLRDGAATLAREDRPVSVRL